MPSSINDRTQPRVMSNGKIILVVDDASLVRRYYRSTLEQAGFKADEMNTKAEITLAKQGDGFAITKSRLTLRAKIPGIDNAKFQELAGMAEKGCPVSKVLNCEISLDAALV